MFYEIKGKIYLLEERKAGVLKLTPVTPVKNRKRILSCFETADLLEELIERQEKERLTPEWKKIDDEYDFYED